MARQPLKFYVREYQKGDAPHIAQLFYISVRGLGRLRYTAEQVAVWAPGPLDPASVHAKTADGRTTLVAVNPSGEVIGYADLEDDGHIDHLYCHPGVSGTGAADQLLDELLVRATAALMPRLYTEASELAKGVFKRKGFELVCRRDFELRGVPIHNFAMERRLN
jgi:putative acetyltransferase